MDKVYIGKIVNTHGIKGELRIKSDFPYKDKIFKINNRLIIDDEEYFIKSYRVHKDFDMVTLNDFTNINDVLYLLKKDVYFNKEEIELNDNEILDEELLNYKVTTTDNKTGKVLEIFMASQNNKIMRVLLDKEVLIPFNSPLIKKIDKEKKEIIIELIEGM